MSQYNFMPHLHCYLGVPSLVWTMFITDLTIGLAYLGISITLWGLVRRIQIPFTPVVLCFGLFIAACGLTHLMEVWTLWYPDYWVSAGVKVVTAAASISTGIYLFQLRGSILKVARTSELSEQRRVDLEVLTRDLERRVEERTSDISLAQEELKESEARFRQLADSMTQLAWIARPDGFRYWYNKRWYDYTGLTFDELEGWGWQQAHHPEHLQRVLDFMSDALKKPEAYELTFPLRDTHGEWRWFLSRVVPLKNAHGDIIQWFGTNTDIHDQKLAEEKLKKAKEEAERANEMKSAFLANMSHEIRTPLGAMLGFADLLNDPALSPAERASYTDILTRNGRQLTGIINDILDFSKVEAGQLVLENTKCDPVVIAEEVVSLFRVKATKSDLVFEFRNYLDEGESLTSDPLRIRQVLMNLVGNALKFTQLGSVLVGLSSAIEDGKRYFVFDITDTGIGISENQRERIFEMFVQADGSMTRKFGGTGLGLALSRRLARELGGDVTISQTVVGKGTTFQFKVLDRTATKIQLESRRRSFAAESPDLDKNFLDGINVLVVDDAADNRLLLWRYITSYGGTVEVSENGLDGYQKASSGNFDVVLMDIQMPVMDGYAATEKLRRNGYTKPIIALTAHAMSEVREECQRVGCSDHLSKPVNKPDLVRMIYRHAHKQFVI